MAGEFQVNFGGLETAAADISAAGKQMESRLNELDRQLAPLRSDWTGAASEAYQRSKAEWTRAVQDLNGLLNEIGRAVSNSHSNYQDYEGAQTNRW
jgi:WXG100 family type VII secretion target